MDKKMEAKLKMLSLTEKEYNCIVEKFLYDVKPYLRLEKKETLLLISAHISLGCIDIEELARKMNMKKNIVKSALKYGDVKEPTPEEVLFSLLFSLGWTHVNTEKILGVFSKLQYYDSLVMSTKPKSLMIALLYYMAGEGHDKKYYCNQVKISDATLGKNLKALKKIITF